MKRKISKFKNKNIKTNKKIIIILICLFIIGHLSTISLADDEDENDNIAVQNEIENIKKENQVIETQNSVKDIKPQINSRRYVIYDRNSGLSIYGKDENKQTAMASTTKIMTAIIVLENCENLNETVTIDSKSAGTGGSRLGLKKDDKITVNDLLYGLLMRSGNDCAVALAKYIAGSTEEFANLMNEKVKELNLKDTHFVTPHGLDDSDHYTTAYELAKLTDYALKNSKFSEIVKTQYTTITINDSSKELKNTNELLCSNIDGVYGVKTGFTNNAGRCLVTAVKRDNMDLIIVVLGADTRNDRAKDSIKLIEYAYKRYRIEDIESLAQEEFEMWQQINQNRIYIEKANNKIELEMGEIPIKCMATDTEIVAEINSLSYLNSPVEKGTRIGTITIKKDEQIIEEINIIVSNEVRKKTILDYLEMYGKIINLA